jgi:UDP-3-O-[3-hydroxymyristoyl] glucosamine N-acyltransferase
MINDNFFSKKKEFFTLKEVLQITKSKLPDGSNCDLDSKIYGVATLEAAGKDDISFFHSAAYINQFLSSNAGFCFIEETFVNKTPAKTIPLINSNPYFAYAVFLSQFYLDKKYDKETPLISEHSIIDSSAKIGSGTKIQAGANIGKNVVIGKNCFIGANSVIGDGCVIGDNIIINPLVSISYCIMGNNVIIHNGAKIGQDGFGFAHNAGKLQKILQLGIVEIHDDVEIGANSCIDRGAISNTIIGKQVKIDNMVQIAHNVIIGEGTVIAGCTAVAGSAKIGRFVQIGGNSSINGHIEIGDGAKIAGASGVAKSVDPMQSVGGYPAMPIKDWHRINIKLMQMLKKQS